uniref:Uncharacterized protein n=1 Tax=Mycena chlorophos TaxID=658473 RepID=A0ABQ0KW97_MYCCL|nr:predicted protein [Mycena chlorophos]
MNNDEAIAWRPPNPPRTLIFLSPTSTTDVCDKSVGGPVFTGCGLSTPSTSSAFVRTGTLLTKMPDFFKNLLRTILRVLFSPWLNLCSHWVADSGPPSTPHTSREVRRIDNVLGTVPRGRLGVFSTIEIFEQIRLMQCLIEPQHDLLARLRIIFPDDWRD